MQVDTEIEKIKTRLQAIESEKNQLLLRLNKLKKERATINNLVELYGSPACREVPQSTDEKVDLFLKLFGCRRDVFPKLWINNRKNTKGYTPVCLHEWDRNYCRKPAIKCSICPNQNFTELDAKAVTNHLLGKNTIGTYAIRQDDTCIFLAADFDKSSWKEDVAAYKNAASGLGVEVTLEISRSCRGY